MTSIGRTGKGGKSGKAKMDEKMQEHMQTDKFGRIEYRLISLKPKSKPGTTGPLEFDAVGTLTIVGKTVTNTMPVTIEKKDGKLKVVGSTPLKMTDYGLKAPEINLLGIPAISVGDELKIKFLANAGRCLSVAAANELADKIARLETVPLTELLRLTNA